MCNIDGYDCTCEEIPDVDPWTRAPTFDCPDVYVDYGMDVPAFNAAQTSYGYDEGWTPIPTGYWGYWIYLDQPELWGHSSHEEWKFGIKLRFDGGETPVYMDWCPVAGVTEFTVDGEWVFRYIYAIPDNDITAGDIDVGDCFTPVYYDATATGGAFDPTTESQMDAPGFCVGAPYLAEMDFYERVVRILFFFADSSGDGCINKDEFFEIIGFYDSNSVIAEV